jgi:hypothetical protein
VREHWGSVGEFDNSAPSAAGDEAFQQWQASLLRLGASPSAAILLGEMTRATDVTCSLSCAFRRWSCIARAIG